MVGRKDVFLMYAKKDMEKVKPILSLFDENGISYYDSNLIANAQSKIANSKCMVFVSTENSRTLECEALKAYIPYAKKNVANIGKIEYVLDPENVKMPIAAKIILKGFFTEEPCKDEESLVEAILTYILESGEEESDIYNDDEIVEEPKKEEPKKIEVEEKKPVVKEENKAVVIAEKEVKPIKEEVLTIDIDEDDYEEIIPVTTQDVVEINEIEEIDESALEELDAIEEDGLEEIVIDSLDSIEDDQPDEEIIEVSVKETKKEETKPIKKTEPIEDLPEADFNVFLCYKERDFFNGSERENDSRDAREIYLYLQREGFKVFFKDESLANIKTPKGKEKYTENAINNAKVMILFASKPEYVDALFVKKDWIKFYTLMNKGEKAPKSLLPIYKNFSPDKFTHPIKNLDMLNKGDSDFKYKLKEYINGILEAKIEQIADKKEEDKKPEIKTVTVSKKKEEKMIPTKGISFVVSKEGLYSAKIGKAVDKNIVLPEDYKGQPIEGVTKEGFLNAVFVENVYVPKCYKRFKENAFGGCTNLKSIIFEDGSQMDTINSNAFDGCISLKEISLPSGIKNLKQNAFSNSGITSLFIPKSVRVVERAAFSGCKNLTKIECESTEPVETWDDKWDEGCLAQITWGGKEVKKEKAQIAPVKEELEFVFETDPTTDTYVLVKCESEEKNIIIPSEIEGKLVTKIKEGAFFDNDTMESVNIPKGIKTIEESAFEGCTHLININFDAEDCDDFEPYNKVFANAGIKGFGLTVKFGASVKKIPENLFYPENGPKRIPYIVEVLFEKGICVNKIRDYAFAYAKSIKHIDLPEGLEVIGVNSFVGCGELQSITLPNTLKEIENYAFSGCSSLENIILPKNLRNIGAGAFSYCRVLQDLVIPQEVSTTGDKVFSDCAKVKTITCMAKTQPAGWDVDWNKGCRAIIKWG